MSMLLKLVKEGWWEDRPEKCDLNVSAIGDDKIEELLTKKSTVFFDEKSGRRFLIRIPKNVSPKDLKDDDFLLYDIH